MKGRPSMLPASLQEPRCGRRAQRTMRQLVPVASCTCWFWAWTPHAVRWHLLGVGTVQQPTLRMAVTTATRSRLASTVTAVVAIATTRRQTTDSHRHCTQAQAPATMVTATVSLTWKKQRSWQPRLRLRPDAAPLLPLARSLSSSTGTSATPASSLAVKVCVECARVCATRATRWPTPGSLAFFVTAAPWPRPRLLLRRRRWVRCRLGNSWA